MCVCIYLVSSRIMWAFQREKDLITWLPPFHRLPWRLARLCFQAAQVGEEPCGSSPSHLGPRCQGKLRLGSWAPGSVGKERESAGALGPPSPALGRGEGRAGPSCGPAWWPGGLLPPPGPACRPAAQPRPREVRELGRLGPAGPTVGSAGGRLLGSSEAPGVPEAETLGPGLLRRPAARRRYSGVLPLICCIGTLIWMSCSVCFVSWEPIKLWVFFTPNAALRASINGVVFG